MTTSRLASTFFATVACALATGCHSDASESADSSSSGGTAVDADSGPSTAGEAATVVDDSGGPSGCAFESDFGSGNAAAWPSPWADLGGVAKADVVGGRGRLLPTTSDYSLARMGTDLPCVDTEVSFSFELTDGTTQGVGAYVRQNGGHLQTSAIHGEGYVVFIEAFREPAGIGIWREVDGVEEQLGATFATAVDVGVVYHARFRVTQQDAASTRLQARMWADGDAEPTEWQVERTDQSPSLQGREGGVAIDAWSSRVSGDAADLFVDDIVVTDAG